MAAEIALGENVRSQNPEGGLLLLTLNLERLVARRNGYHTRGILSQTVLSDAWYDQQKVV